MTIRHLFLIAVVLMANANLFGQGIRVPGYVVKASGDTLRGFIIDRRDNWHVAEVEFASSESSPTEKYPVPSMKGFYLEPYRVFYKSAVTEIDIKPVDLDHLEPDGTRNLVMDTLLLERIATGPINLYRYEGKRNKRHFFVEKDDALTELPFVRFQGPNGVVNARTYLQTLRTMTSDCGQRLTLPNDYSDNTLTKFIRTYNECRTGKVESKRTALRLSVGLVAGAGISNVKVSSNENETGTSQQYLGSYGTSNSFHAGIAVWAVSKREANPNSLGMQALYTRYSNISRKWESGFIEGTYEIDVATMDVGFTYRYRFLPGKKISPFFELEANVVFVSSANATRYTRNTLLGSDVTSSEFTSFSKIGISAAPVIGVLFFDRLSVDLRYKYKSLTTESSNQVPFSGPQLTVGFVALKY